MLQKIVKHVRTKRLPRTVLKYAHYSYEMLQTCTCTIHNHV